MNLQQSRNNFGFTMGDPTLNTTLSLDDSTVIDDDVMGLVDELEREEQSLLSVNSFDSFVYRNVSCQTEYDTYGSSSIPIIFCGLISPAGDAMTQCDIPKKVNIGISTVDVGEKTFPKANPSNQLSKEKMEKNFEISAPAVVHPHKDIINLQNLRAVNPNLSVNNPDKFLVANKSMLTVAIKRGTKDTGSGFDLERLAQNSTEGLSKTSANNVTTFKADISSPSAKSKNPESRSGTDDESDSFSENEDLVIEEEDDAEESDCWEEFTDATVKKEAVVTHEVLNGDVVDEQLMAVEECLKRIKTEPVDYPTEDPIKVPKKARLNLLQTVFQQNIKIEAEEEWITDDEVDDDVDDTFSNLWFEKSIRENDQRTCNECNLTFNSPLLLIEHSEANHVANICNICGFTTTFKNKLDRHMVKHTKEKAFICDICGKQYSQKQNLRDHISRSHTEEDSSNRYPYSCVHCKRMYRNENNLLKHLEQTNEKCDTCNEVCACPGLLFLHKKNHVSSNCELCDKVFASRNALQIHINIKHKDKGLQCSMCPKKFLFPSYLKLHFANAHSQISPTYKCQECGFCAVTESYLKSHTTRMHSKSSKNKYMCQVCKKSFRSNARLVEHTRIHTGERPFSCPVCFKTFYSQSNLYSHERTVHGRLNNYGTKDLTVENQANPVMRKVFSSCYQCQNCSSTFNNKKKLKAHMAAVHNIGKTTSSGRKRSHSNNLDNVEVDNLPFEIGGETTIHAGEGTISGKGEVDSLQTLGNENVSARSALSLPAYVVPPNINLVEIDGVQYHVIRGNT